MRKRDSHLLPPNSLRGDVNSTSATNRLDPRRLRYPSLRTRPIGLIENVAAAVQGATSSALEDKPAEDQVDAATAAAIDAVEGLDETTKKDWLIVISFLFAAVAVTTAWMIGLVWGAIALMRWLFS